jgi:hypothetical protein
MQMLGCLAAIATPSFADPVLQVFDRIATNAKLDEMECHARLSSKVLFRILQ